jgi:feruloyl esterase
MSFNRSIVTYFVAIAALMFGACGAKQDGPSEEAVAVAERSSCSLESLRGLPDVRLTSVTEEAAPVPHCKVSGVIGAETHFELLLPETWNGKFAMGGGGGFVGSVMNTSLMYGSLQAGYATVGTDTGHQGHPLDASWALNNLERLVSFGHQAVHRTAVTAKALIKDYYGAEIARKSLGATSPAVRAAAARP